MRRKKQAWAMIGLIAAPIGGALGRLHVIGPNPGTFFALGILATLSIIGMIHGILEGLRAYRSNQPISH